MKLYVCAYVQSDTLVILAQKVSDSIFMAMYGNCTDVYIQWHCSYSICMKHILALKHLQFMIYHTYIAICHVTNINSQLQQ